MASKPTRKPKFRLGPMHSDYWPWEKVDGHRWVRSWFIWRLCQVFPGREFWGHTYYPDGMEPPPIRKGYERLKDSGR